MGEWLDQLGIMQTQFSFAGIGAELGNYNNNSQCLMILSAIMQTRLSYSSIRALHFNERECEFRYVKFIGYEGHFTDCADCCQAQFQLASQVTS